MCEKKQDKSKSLQKTVITEYRKKKKGYVNPVLVSFQNGEVNPDKASNFKVRLTPNESGGTKVEVQAPEGHVFKESDFNTVSRPTEILAIRNRITNKMRLIEVDSAVLINSALLNLTKEKVVEAETNKNLKMLNKTFGGKKITSRLEQREKLNINSSLGADDIKDVISDIKVEESVSSVNNETESITDLLPPCHRSVSSLSDVYLLSEIFSYEEMESLKSEVVNNLLEKKKLDPQEYSQFFLLCFERAKKSEEDVHNKLAAVLFAEALIKFLKIPSKKLMSKKLVLCPFSNLIHAKLLNEFCIKTDSSITRPLTLRDKALCYIMVMGLLSCNYQINLKTLASSVSVHLSSLSRLARVVGAVPVAKDQPEFVLKLPLPALPKSSRGKVKRK